VPSVVSHPTLAPWRELVALGSALRGESKFDQD
jgi:hypothetical protein